MEKLGFFPPPLVAKLSTCPIQNRIWIHTASGAELNTAKPVILKLLELGYPLILSTTEEACFRMASTAYPDITVLYLPFDLPWLMQKTIRLLNPSLIVMLERGVYPNLLCQAYKTKIPVIMMYGRLSQSKFHRYRLFKYFFQYYLNRYSAIFMQSFQDAQRMLDLGVWPDKVKIMNNPKFDIPPVIDTPRYEVLARYFACLSAAPVIFFASSHRGEEKLFIKMFQNLQRDIPALKGIFAPRHAERIEPLKALLDRHEISWLLRTQLQENQPLETLPSVIVIDTMGELGILFAFGTVVCMGGSFVNWGGHNPIEPINAGIPVIMGPFMDNFTEIVERMLEAEVAFQADSIETAEQLARDLLLQPDYYDRIARHVSQWMLENRTLTQRTVRAVLSPPTLESVL